MISSSILQLWVFGWLTGFMLAQERKYICKFPQSEVRQGEIVLACIYVLVNFYLNFRSKIRTEQDVLACSSKNCLRPETPYSSILLSHKQHPSNSSSKQNS